MRDFDIVEEQRATACPVHTQRLGPPVARAPQHRCRRRAAAAGRDLRRRFAHGRRQGPREHPRRPRNGCLLAAEHVAVSFAAGGGSQVVRVRARLGLGDGERDPKVPRCDASQPRFLLLGAAVVGDPVADDRGRDDEQQQRASGGGDLLCHGREAAHTHSPAAPALGQVDPQVAALGERVPEFAWRFPRLGLPGVARRPEVGANRRHGLTQQALLVGGTSGSTANASMACNVLLFKWDTRSSASLASHGARARGRTVDGTQSRC